MNRWFPSWHPWWHKQAVKIITLRSPMSPHEMLTAEYCSICKACDFEILHPYPEGSVYRHPLADKYKQETKSSP